MALKVKHKVFTKYGHRVTLISMHKWLAITGKKGKEQEV
jgi:hypothetical protein